MNVVTAAAAGWAEPARAGQGTEAGQVGENCSGSVDWPAPEQEVITIKAETDVAQTFPQLSAWLRLPHSPRLSLALDLALWHCNTCNSHPYAVQKNVAYFWAVYFASACLSNRRVLHGKMQKETQTEVAVAVAVGVGVEVGVGVSLPAEQHLAVLWCGLCGCVRVHVCACSNSATFVLLLWLRHTSGRGEQKLLNVCFKSNYEFN